MPYLDPPVPEEPTNATLFCNLNILYVERCSADSVTDFPFDKPILPLLDTYLPGSTPTAPAGTQYDIALQPDTSLRIQSMDITHPTNWDPKYEFKPSGLSLYATTQRGNIIRVTAGMTLADVCAEAKRISPGPPDQKATYRDDGEYIKIMEGMITIYAFRDGSEAQKRFVNKENFGNFVNLADPGEHHV
ncbi:hypothetical protein FRC12_008915 [Ceratobasidium sp. 428]|nr:hypothetical protein FRC12_008915 [Ceratobasidium sp. 428]